LKEMYYELKSWLALVILCMGDLRGFIAEREHIL